MIMRIENPRVVAAIIDCYNLPISKRCEFALVWDRGITFMVDECDNQRHSCTFTELSLDVEIRWWGPTFNFYMRGDIGHWQIDATTGEAEYVCGYTREGRLKYGRYYEPQMD